MYLKSISFSHKPSKGDGWSIENCSFDSINLIAGKNASGKTRLLHSINNLVLLLSSDKAKIKDNISVNWLIKLQDMDEEIAYEFSYEDKRITEEEFKINDDLYLTRNSEGKGSIRYTEPDQMINFEIEINKIALTSKRDKKQHPFLEKLLIWANSVFLYNFGGLLGKNTLTKLEIKSDKLEFDMNELTEINKDEEGVIPKFILGMKKFGNDFKDRVLADFNKIKYDVKDINTVSYEFSELDNKFKGLPIPDMLYIVENGSSDKIFQRDISQGMFRALSLLIQLTFLEFNLASHSTILIDDIGEGIDFERSTELIKLLIYKAEQLKDKIQLIMTTNDRFVMNNVSLDYWIVVDKSSGNNIDFYSKSSNPKLFETFKDIGLNNFDFFTGEYYK